MRRCLLASLFGLALLCLWGPQAFAACTGSGLNWNATPTSADIIACIANAPDGATINVSAGSATWASRITTSTTKDVAIIGAGSGQTLITCNNGCFHLSSQRTARISGFSFTSNGTNDELFQLGTNDNTVPGKTLRVDHNAFLCTGSCWGVLQVSGGSNGVHVTSLFDHNTLTNVTIKTAGTQFGRDEGSAQDVLWAQTVPPGTGTRITYVEDNVFTSTQKHPNYADGNWGGRYVFRFNTMGGQMTTNWEVHSVQGNNRAVQLWEFYKNTITQTDSGFMLFAYIRGGTGMMWGNRGSDPYSLQSIEINNVRSCRDPGSTNGKCSGASNWDGNTSGQQGYPCRDQLGRSHDTVVWITGAAYTQVLNPAYFWDNKRTSNQAEYTVDIDALESCSPSDLNALHIQNNRDYYQLNASFTGASGVGIGTLAARPATCTAGVAYWATDQGEWNSLNPGPDGQLYKCTATNTWTLYYIPFPYPHPLQSAAAGGPPSPPTNLRVP